MSSQMLINAIAADMSKQVILGPVFSTAGQLACQSSSKTSAGPSALDHAADWDSRTVSRQTRCSQELLLRELSSCGLAVQTSAIQTQHAWGTPHYVRAAVMSNSRRKRATHSDPMRRVQPTRNMHAASYSAIVLHADSEG